jgi:hypothetical protein
VRPVFVKEVVVVVVPRRVNEPVPLPLSQYIWYDVNVTDEPPFEGPVRAIQVNVI